MEAGRSRARLVHLARFQAGGAQVVESARVQQTALRSVERRQVKGILVACGRLGKRLASLVGIPSVDEGEELEFRHLECGLVLGERGQEVLLVEELVRAAEFRGVRFLLLAHAAWPDAPFRGAHLRGSREPELAILWAGCVARVVCCRRGERTLSPNRLSMSASNLAIFESS